MSIEQDPCPRILPRASIQEDRTDFYEDKINENLEKRKEVSDAMTWLRPVRRLSQVRLLNKLDYTISWMAVTLQESLEADQILAKAAAEHTVAAVEHSEVTNPEIALASTN